MTQAVPKTPWQRVYFKFGVSQSKFAALLKKHRSKVSRALKDPEGLINGRDQKLLFAVAKEEGVSLTPDDMLPGR